MTMKPIKRYLDGRPALARIGTRIEEGEVPTKIIITGVDFIQLAKKVDELIDRVNSLLPPEP